MSKYGVGKGTSADAHSPNKSKILRVKHDIKSNVLASFLS